MIGTPIRALRAVACSVALVGVLAGCGGGAGGTTAPTVTVWASPTLTPSPTTSAPTTPPAATPKPTATASASATATAPAPAKPVTLPTKCSALGSKAERQKAVGDMTLQSNGVGFVRPVPAKAKLALGCDWIVGDSTGMLLLLSTAAPANVSAEVKKMPARGYTCSVSDDFGADFCQKKGSGPNTEEMIVAREGIWLYLSTSNRSGRAFLSSIATQLWG